MASPWWQCVAWSQFSELSNKSQKNGDYNGEAGRHLTVTVQTEGYRRPQGGVLHAACSWAAHQGAVCQWTICLSINSRTLPKSLQAQREETSFLFAFPTSLAITKYSLQLLLLLLF